MKPSFCILILIIIFVGASTMASTAEQVFANLAKIKKIEGDFTQDRFIKNLNNNLLSSGKFEFKLNQSLKWNQINPLPLNMTILKDKIIQEVEGVPKQEITKQDKPEIFKVNEIIFSMMSGDFKALSKVFKVNHESKSGKWFILLTPKDKLLKKVIKKVSLNGDKYIEFIELTEINNSYTKINFSVKEKGIETIQ